MTDAEIDAISANQVTYGDEKVDAFRKGFRAAEARQPSAWDQAIEADLRKEITDKVWAEYSIARQKDATLASISVHQLRTAIRLTLDVAIRALAQQEQQAPAMRERKCDFRSVDPAEWSDTFECSVCKQRYTYAAEDCMTAEILNKTVPCIHSATNPAPAQTGEKK